MRDLEQRWGGRAAWLACALGLWACGTSGAPTDIDGGGASGGSDGSGGAAATGGQSAAGGADPTGGSGGVPTNDGGSPTTGGSTAETGGQDGSGSGGLPGVGGGPATLVEAEVDDLPTVRQEHAGAALGDEVYVLGGFTPEDTATVAAYTPATGDWRTVADFPVLFHHPNVASVGSRLYVVGFHAGGGSLRVGDGRAFAYDPEIDDWLPLASMPVDTGRGASCVASLGEEIYVFGGSNDATLALASVYDTGADSWDELPNLPEPRDHCLAAAIGDLIYIVGGRDGGIADIEGESWVFDPTTGLYEEIEPLPTLRAGVAGGVLGGHIIVAGGEGNADDPVGIFHEVESYDPLTGLWTEHADLSTPRHGFAGAVLGDQLYLLGGGTTEGLAPSSAASVLSLTVP